MRRRADVSCRSRGLRVPFPRRQRRDELAASSSDAHASSRSSSARSTRRRRGAARPSSSPERRASARPGSRPSSRRAPAPRGSRSCSGARSISSARSCRTSRSSRRCVRSESLRARPGSQLRVFEETLALLTERAAAAPVLFVLEDLHWADTSTLDLVVFLAHNLDERRLALLATYRADEPASAERVRRLADGVRRSGSALVLELGPLGRRGADGAARGPRRQAAARGGADGRDRRPLGGQPVLRRGAACRRRRSRAASSRAACARCCCGAWPGSTLGRRRLLRLAAAAGRDVGYPLLRALAALPEHELRESLRRAVEHGVLVADQATGSFRFRHALLAEAIYATILPGEREELHGAARRGARAQRGGRRGGARAALGGGGSQRRGAGRVGRGGARGGGRLRAREAWRTSSGRSRCGIRCPTHPSRWGSTSPSSAPGPRSSPARRATRRARWSSRGERSSSSARRPARARRSCTSASAATCSKAAAATLSSAASERALELVPAQPPSPQRAQALAGHCGRVAPRWLALRGVARDRRAGARARARGRRARRQRSGRSRCSAADLAYLGRGDEGLAQLGRPCELAEEIGDPLACSGVRLAHRRAHDARTAGRVGAARGGRARGDAPHGGHAPCWPRTGSRRCSRSGSGTRRTRPAPPRSAAITASYPHMLLMLRADLEVGRGQFDAARAHLEAARSTVRETAAWRPTTLRRRARPVGAPMDGRRRGHRDGPGPGAPADGEPRSASGSAPRDCARRRSWRRSRAPAATRTPSGDGLARADLLDGARAPRPRPRRSPRTPRAGARWPRPSTTRARRVARPDPWSGAAGGLGPTRATAARRLLPLAPGRGARRRRRAAPDATASLREAHAVAARIGAQPLLRELELLAERARLDLSPPDARPPENRTWSRLLGLTPREAEVLTLVARGLHQPRDRRRARDQRQDRQRPRLPHPAQARRAEPARSGRDRPPPRPATTARHSLTPRVR